MKWTWLRLPAIVFAACMLVLASGFAQAAPATVEITRAEAVRADWDSAAPPTIGWTPVDLMDFWDARWPEHDGVVWYRIRWQQADAEEPVGLLVDYVCLASAIYVNGSLVGRDRNLVEPLSRSWIQPQYFLVDAPTLRVGENTLLVRVSGLAAYQPGFGTVTVGDPQAVHAQYRRGLLKRFEIKLVNVAMSLVLGAIFLMLWLLRRQDTVYGWFALSELTGSVYGYNYLAPSPWPFASTDAWQAFIAAMWVVAGSCYAMFLLRFGERSFPRVQRLMGLSCIAALGCFVFAPHWMGEHRMPWVVIGSACFYVSTGWFVMRALRIPRADYRVLAVCLAAPLLVTVRDIALYLGWVRDDTYLSSLTSILTLIGIAFVVAHRFVAAMRRVEGFNLELKREVATATRELGETLQREHQLALAHGRAGERLQLVRDLHDGFGGTLVGAIAQLEQADEGVSRQDVVGVLKEMRDDLRLVIDSTAREQADLGELLAPLRHRSSTLLEAAGIDIDWHVAGIEGIELGSARSLDLMRLLQEALTNAFKHSRARRVAVRMERIDNQLHLHVSDDGRGLHRESPMERATGGGAGMASMRLRARRLGGALEIDSRLGGTDLRLAFPLSA
ncbi:MAG: ATP-binding protein [Pseudomonadota bacterium]|nr:ATP-binding protein [Pseudomonadota bacterium]